MMEAKKRTEPPEVRKNGEQQSEAEKLPGDGGELCDLIDNLIREYGTTHNVSYVDVIGALEIVKGIVVNSMATQQHQVNISLDDKQAPHV